MLKKLNYFSHMQIIALMFVLTTAVFPVGIAIAKQRLITRQLTYQAMTPLLDQIRATGENANMELNDDELVVTVGDISYTYFNLQQIRNGGIASVSVFNQNEWLYDVDLAVARQNQNKLNIEVDYYSDTGNHAFTSGVLNGTGNKTATMIVDVDGREHSGSVNYASIATAPLHMQTWHSTDGMRFEPVEFTVAVAVIIVVVLFVLVGCIAFGWFGCD